ncbi:NAD(+) diphosphatase [Propionibacteriaceae bacterium G1746]
MSRFDLHPHSNLRRAGQERVDPERLVELFTGPGAQVLVVSGEGQFHVEPAEGGFDADVHSYLGWTDANGHAHNDAEASLHWFTRRGASEGQTLRDGFADPAMHDLVAAAAAILAWHDGAPPCGRCGAVTVPVRGGFMRQCVECGHLEFPRHDPAIIVAITDPDDRLLLAHQANWPEGRVSVIAGFVEAGESLEQAVGREVGEEVGLWVDRVRYVASQPWPFPRSLMLAFVATAMGEPVPDGTEIAWARWFSRDEFTAAVESGELSLPGRGSVGGRLIHAWVAGELPSV